MRERSAERPPSSSPGVGGRALPRASSARAASARRPLLSPEAGHRSHPFPSRYPASPGSASIQHASLVRRALQRALHGRDRDLHVRGDLLHRHGFEMAKREDQPIPRRQAIEQRVEPAQEIARLHVRRARRRGRRASRAAGMTARPALSCGAARLEQANREREDEAAQPVGRAQRVTLGEHPVEDLLREVLGLGLRAERAPRHHDDGRREAVPCLSDRPAVPPPGHGPAPVARVAGIGSDHQRDGHVGAAGRHELCVRGLLSSRHDAPNWLIFSDQPPSAASAPRTNPMNRQASFGSTNIEHHTRGCLAADPSP